MFRSIGPLELFFLLFILPFIVAFIWALVDVIRRPERQFPNGTGKTGWIVGLLVASIFGVGWLVAIIYLLRVRRPMGPIQATSPGESLGSASPPSA